MFDVYVKSRPEITLRQITEAGLSGANDSLMADTASQVSDYMRPWQASSIKTGRLS